MKNGFYIRELQRFGTVLYYFENGRLEVFNPVSLEWEETILINGCEGIFERVLWHLKKT